MNKKDFISFSSNYELIERKIKKIYIFCSLCSDIDFNSIKYKKMKVQINDVYVSFNNINKMYKKRLLSFGYKEVVKFIYVNNLSNDFQIKKIMDYKKESFNKTKSEKIYKEGINSAKNEYIKLINQLTFNSINNNKKLTVGNYSAYLNDNNRCIRKQAFINYFSTIYKNKDNFYNTFERYIISYSKLTKINNYTSSLKRYCINNNFSYNLYNDVISIINDNLSSITSFLDMKKQILKINDFEYYDIFAPVSDSSNYSYNETVSLISNSLSVLGNEYLEIVKKVFLKIGLMCILSQIKKAVIILLIVMNHIYLLILKENIKI